jgi:shikimate dehydrogenase
MHPDMDSMPPIPPESFHSGMLAYDLIYNPYETRFLRFAREAGAKTLNGLEMLLQQGAAAFQIWTQREPSVEAMREAAKRKMSVP